MPILFFFRSPRNAGSRVLEVNQKLNEPVNRIRTGYRETPCHSHRGTPISNAISQLNLAVCRVVGCWIHIPLGLEPN